MKLRDKTLLILGATILFLGILLYYFTQQVFLESYNQLDHERAYRRLAEIEKIIDGAHDRTEMICKDYAKRAEVRGSGADAGGFETADYGGPLARNLDFIVMMDSGGSVISSRLNAEAGSSALREEVAEHLFRYIDSGQHNAEESLTGLASIDGSPFISSMVPLKIGSESDDQRGAIMVGRRIDDEYLGQLGVVARHRHIVEVVDLSSENDGYDGVSAGIGGVWISEQKNDMLSAGKSANDIYGKRAFLYRVEIERESMMQGRAVLGYFIFFLVLSGILLGVVVFLQLELNFFKPLIQLGGRLNKIGAEGDLSERLEYSGHDEIHGLTRDIDSMLLALEASALDLTGSEHRFQELFNNIKSGVEVYSVEEPHGRLVLEDINSTALRLSGFEENAVKGSEILENYPELRGTELYMSILEVRDGNDSIHLDPAFYDTEHMHGWREYQIYKLPSNKVVVLCDDVTARMEIMEELNQKQLELNQSQKLDAIGRLAGGIAHDFNNILTVVNGVSEILLLSMDDKDPIRGDLEEINAAGQRAADLTSQLLAFSRRQIMKTRVLDMNEVIGNIRKMLTRLIGETIELKMIQSGKPALVLADSGQMEQVLVNLVLNARDAMPEGGHLEIETSIQNLEAKHIAKNVTMESVKPESGSYVVIRVTDTGVGMDADILSCICDPFFTTKEEGKGTGLGLSTTYGIIRQSNGFMWFDSHPGRGTVCSICLPAAEREVKYECDNIKEGNMPKGNETILLAEDEEDLRNVVKRFLEHLGFSVLVASNAEEAIDIEKTFDGKIDLLLLDIVMPGMNGPDLWQLISSKRKNVKAVFITGYATEAAVRHAVDREYHIITKPFNMIDLVTEIRSSLDEDASRGNTSI